MIKITTIENKIVEIEFYPPEQEKIIVGIFNQLPKEEIEKNGDKPLPFKGAEHILIKEVKKIEAVKSEDTIRLDECLPYCSEEFLQELMKKGR